LEDLGVNGKINRTYLREIEWEGVEWINLAEGRDQWRALVDTIMNFRFP